MAIEAEAALLAFDRQNHMGASEQLTKKLKQTINDEAELLLAEKRTAAGAVNIKTNEERMKVRNEGGKRFLLWHNRQAGGLLMLVPAPLPNASRRLVLRMLLILARSLVPLHMLRRG